MALINSDVIPASATAEAYPINQSLRFNDDDSSYLTWTPSSAGNRKTWTWSAWVKRGNLSSNKYLFQARIDDTTAEGNKVTCYLLSDNTIRVLNQVTVWKQTSATFRDTSAWYHIVITVDTTQSTASNRVRIYINGEEASYSTNNAPSQNADLAVNSTNAHYIGQEHGGASYFDGYLAEINFIDGQALDPSYFGETGTYGEWKPIEYTGTYGANGFYLDFSNEASKEIKDVASSYPLSIQGTFTQTSETKFDTRALDFTATDSKTVVQGSNSTLFPTGSNQRTYEAWVYYDTSGSSTRSLSIADSYTGDYYGVRCYIEGSNAKPSLFVQKNGGNYTERTVVSSTALSSGWNHVAYEYNSTTYSIYLNGSRTAQETHSNVTLGDSGNITIGICQQCSGHTQDKFPYVEQVRFSSGLRYNSSSYTVPSSAFTTDSDTLVLLKTEALENLVGADASSNSNHWTPNNIDTSDQVLDTPTNNFPTLNPNANPSGASVSEGNLRATGTGNDKKIFSTQTIKGGKWYWEIYLYNQQNRNQLGVVSDDVTWNNTNVSDGTVEKVYCQQGNTRQRDETQEYTNSVTGTWATGDIITVAFDADNGKIWMHKNQVPDTSTTPSTTAGTGTTGMTTSLTYIPYYMEGGTASTNIFNFGQDSSFAGSKTAQGNTDDNEIGDFYYSPPSGFLALCTANLPDPDVVPSEHFNTLLYTGSGSAGYSVTGVGFAPDFLWIKRRNAASTHCLSDNVRGDQRTLFSNSSLAEYYTTHRIDTLDSDGFTFAGTDADVNSSGQPYVAWNWKANGSGSSNTNGSVTSTVSANQDAGFSIVTYTGGDSDETVGHGLSQAPEVVIVKRRNSTGHWASLWKNLTTTNKQLYLNLNNALDTNNISDINASTFRVSSWSDVVVSGGTYVAYCFHSVDGYSRVGSYTGNGDTNGTFVYTGFRPAYIMVKRTDDTNWWNILDNKRDTYNPEETKLFANDDDAEYATTFDWCDFLSNGFKLKGNHTNGNASGSVYVYIAFAETPFKHTNAR